MRRRGFVAAVAALGVASCARMEKRSARYDPKECPFCSTNPGSCTYCNASGKCSYCDGTGKRKSTTSNYPDPNIQKATYEIDCPYCKATGKCRYCDGVGKCWACKGTGEIENWDFHEKHQAREQAEEGPSEG